MAARIEEIEEIVVSMSRLKKKMKEKAAALEQATAEGESSWDAPPPSRRQDACASAGGTAYWPGAFQGTIQEDARGRRGTPEVTRAVAQWARPIAHGLGEIVHRLLPVASGLGKGTDGRMRERLMRATAAATGVPWQRGPETRPGEERAACWWAILLAGGWVMVARTLRLRGGGDRTARHGEGAGPEHA